MTADSRLGANKEENDGEKPPETTRALLMRSLLTRYADLKARLSRTLGADLASDALHETWLRLESRKEMAPVGNPDAYLYRAAPNTANTLTTTSNRPMTFMDVKLLMDDSATPPGP